MVAVLGAGGGALAAIVAAILLNSRFLPMGVAVAPFLKGGPLRRALEGQAVVDASWALASRGGDDREYMMGATLPQVVAWIGGTVIGVLGSDVVGDVQRLGLDAIFPAFFMALLVDELRVGQTIAAALIAAALSLALVPLVPPGVPVIAACAGALLGLRGRSSRHSGSLSWASPWPALRSRPWGLSWWGQRAASEGGRGHRPFSACSPHGPGGHRDLRRDGHLVLDARAVGVGWLRWHSLSGRRCSLPLLSRR